jgi:hypothetical protein
MKPAQSAVSDSGKATILSLLIAFFCGFIILSPNLLLRIIGGSILFTFTFSFYPDSFRSRSGSLAPAFCLTVFVWLCAAVGGVMSLLGAVDLR